MTTKQLETIVGKVSDLGVFDNLPIKCKLEGRGDDWINFSKPEYRGHFEQPERGDHVKLGVSHAQDGRIWASTCEIQKRGNGPQSTYDDGQVPAGGRDLSIMRQVCLKAATEIVTGRMAHYDAGYVNGEAAWTVAAGVDVLALAQDFERWLIRGDPPFA